jgi:anhydro-N-acetylmuramic acid kinase
MSYLDDSPMPPILVQLLAIAEKPARTVVGLISGTSADAIDVAVCRIAGDGISAGSGVRLLQAHEEPYDRSVRDQVRDASSLRARDLAELNVRVGELFADACLAALQAAGIDPSDVDLVGSHGQTVYHHSSVPGAVRATLQVGDGDVIAERTGLPVVSDLRARDIAAGGEGAPITPLADRLLFAPRDPTGAGPRRRAVLNLGGIANLTVLDDDPTRIFGFDIGPANALLDRLARKLSRGVLSCDRDGEFARLGRVDDALLNSLLTSDPFLNRLPPKSTGFEMYGDEFVARAITRHGGLDNHLMATLTEFSARAVALALTDLVRVDPPVEEIVVAGGGVKNPALLDRIKALIAPIPVRLSDQLGVPADAREAMGMAVLANAALLGQPMTTPRTTGARHPVVLGKLSFPGDRT